MSQESISPLTLIAVFAGVIEASALASLPFLSEDSQIIYTWFLVGFPFFLTVLFFLTLNFNSDSLFVPDKSETPSACMPPPMVPPTAPPLPVEEQASPGIDEPSREAQKEAMVIAISGPDSHKMIESHLLRMINRPHATTRRWVLYNLDTRACIHFSVGPMHGNVETSFENEPTP